MQNAKSRFLLLLIVALSALAFTTHCGSDERARPARPAGSAGMAAQAGQGGGPGTGGGAGESGGVGADGGSSAEAGASGAGASGAGASGAGAGNTDGYRVDYLVAPDSPAFLAVHDNQENALFFLAAKDTFGNPVAVTGVAFFHGDEYVRIERDILGRPRVIETQDETILFDEFEKNSFRVTLFTPDAPAESATIEASEEDIARLTIPAPELGLMLKSADSSVFGTLADYADAVQCVRFLGQGLAEDASGGLRAKRGVINGALKCAGDLLSDEAREQLNTAVRVAGDVAAIYACLAGLATSEFGVGAIIAVLSCHDAVEGATDLGRELGKLLLKLRAYVDPPFDQKRLAASDFFLLLDETPAAGESDDITVRLVFKGEEDFTSVVADLSELGGPPDARLTKGSAGWAWTGRVSPPANATIFTLYVSVEGSELTPAGGGRLRLFTDLEVGLKASSTIVTKGQSVTLTGSMRGGFVPYLYAWELGEGLGEIFETRDKVVTTTVSPQRGSDYLFFVGDDTEPVAVSKYAKVRVEVCGDGVCSEEERGGFCIDDCNDFGTGGTTGAGGATGTGGTTGGTSASGGASASGGLGGMAGGGAGGMAGAGGTGSGASGGSSGGGPRLPPKVWYQATEWGEPHLTTFDGLNYDLQAVGELTLMRDETDGMEVQVRTIPAGASTLLAVAVGVAARVGNDRVGLYLGKPSTLNGVETEFAVNGTDLPDGGIAYVVYGGHVVQWPDGTQLAAVSMGGGYRIALYAPPSRAGKLAGLLGGYDGSLVNELLSRDGAVLPRPADFETFYGVFAESWRITQETSLFDYGPGENTETYTDRNFPRWLMTTAALDSAARSHAEDVCAAAGVTDPFLLDACLLDVGATGDDSFADAYAELPEPAESLEVLPPRITGGMNGGGLGYTPSRSGSLEPGGENFYSFHAELGEAIVLRAVDVAGGPFTPWLRVYDAAGTLVSNDYRSDVAYASFNAASSGTFTAVVSDAAAPSSTPVDYTVHFVKAPGSNEGGALTSGTVVSESIEKGDLDSYTFTANAGEVVQLRFVDVAGSTLTPGLAVYDPTGAAASWDTRSDVAYASFNAAVSGTYTVVVYDWSSNSLAGAGDYQLHFVKGPGATEHGALTPGTVVSGTIEKGDVDSYSFTADAGEAVQLRFVDVAGSTLTPGLAVYGPTGAAASWDYRSDVAYASFNAAVSGTYTVVVYDWSSGSLAGTGDYALHFVKGPGSNEGGALTSGTVVSGTIEKGDLDSYSFAASAGEAVQLRFVDVAGSTLTPGLAVYGPTGASVSWDYRSDVAYAAFNAAVSGSYTVVVYDWSSNSLAGTGDYQLHFAKAPGASEGGALTPGSAAWGTIDKGDLDSYTFTATSGTPVKLTLSGPGFTPALNVFNPAGAPVTSGYAANSVSVTFTPTATGTYTVFAYDWTSGLAGSGAYTLLLE